MRLWLMALIMAALAVTAFAAKPELPVDGRGVKIQGFAPDGKKAVSLTKNSTTTDMRDDIQYAVFALQSSCKFRNQSTVTKAGTLRYLPKGNIYNRLVNQSTPFLNTTSCANVTLERH
jgi:hypothetical protein